MGITQFFGRLFNRYKMGKYQKQLAQKKSSQKNKFDELKGRFAEKYNKLKGYDIEKFTTPSWKEFNARMEGYFLPTPKFSFLTDDTIKFTMFIDQGGKLLNHQLSFLENEIPETKLRTLLEEDYVGTPPLRSSKYMSSHNSIHHLYHLLFFAKETKSNFSEFKNIIEWGGGYGNLAKLTKRLNDNCTYTIVDTPIFSCIQWLYLSSVLGEDKVNLLEEKEDKIQKGKINLLPICFLEDHNLKTDLFVSTWALSESSEYCHDYVVGKNWFEGKNLLLAYQDNNIQFPSAERVGLFAGKSGAKSTDIIAQPTHHYAFK